MFRETFLCSFLLVAFGGLAHAQSSSQIAGEGASLLPDCPVRMAGRSGTLYVTEPIECYCSAEARRARGAYAYGSGPYDGISNICMAALHAGATGPEGGDVRVIPGPIQQSFTGSLANGVFSSDWDHPSQFGSFNVERATGQ